MARRSGTDLSVCLSTRAASRKKMNTGQARKAVLQQSPAPETSVVQELKPTLTNQFVAFGVFNGLFSPMTLSRLFPISFC